MERPTGTGGVIVSTVLGRRTVFRPLRVDLEETGSGWIAKLEPGEMTCHEWGWGRTEREAIDDLASTVEEVYECLAETPDSRLGEDLLGYKRVLREYTVINTSRPRTG